MADFNIQVPGLPYYLGLKKALIDANTAEQQQGLQQEFLRRRAELGDNPTSDQLTNLGMQFATPHELVQYGQANQLKRETLLATLQHHNELINVARERNQIMQDNNLARVKDKEAQDAIMNGFRERDRQLQQQKLDNDNMIKQLMGGIAQQNADTNRMRAEQQGNKLDEPLLNFIDKIDATKRMIEQNPEAVGGRGMLGRGAEFIGGLVNPGQETPASNLQSQILDLQTNYRGLPGHAQSRLKIDAANIDKLIKGLGTFTTADQALGSLDTLRESFVRALGRKGIEAPSGELNIPAPTSNPSPSANTPQRIRSEADYNALPSGSLYIAPDGSIRKKK